MRNSTQPLRKQSKTAPLTPKPWLFSRVRRPAMAVGPMGASLQLPKIVYKMQAM